MWRRYERDHCPGRKKTFAQKGTKKLTVKDLVEECHITRQAFYYHFEDIPALLRWMFERDTQRNMLEAKNLKNGEERLRYLFVMPSTPCPM